MFYICTAIHHCNTMLLYLAFDFLTLKLIAYDVPDEANFKSSVVANIL